MYPPLQLTDQLQLLANPLVYLGTSHPSLHPESSVVHAWQYRIIYCYVRRRPVSIGEVRIALPKSMLPQKTHIQPLSLYMPWLHLSAFLGVEPERSDCTIDV